MVNSVDAPVTFAVEGSVDEAVVLKIFKESGVAPGTSYVCDGIDRLRKNLRGFNAAAKYSPWFVLCDLDRNECAPALCDRLLGDNRAEKMQLRVAVRAVEAWLMADRRAFANFLGVRQARVPSEPEQEPDPKTAVVRLAQQSSKRSIREGLAPSETGGRRVGSAYSQEMIQYVHAQWSPRRASAGAPSLARALELCKAFSRQGTWS